MKAIFFHSRRRLLPTAYCLLITLLMQVININTAFGKNNFDFTPVVSGYNGQQNIFIADMDNDGFKDIIMSDNSNNITVSMNNDNLTFANFNSNMAFSTGTYATLNLGSKKLIGVSDMNGGGYADLLVYEDNYNANDDALLLYINNGNGFSTPVLLTQFPSGNWQMIIGNINTANVTVDIVGYNAANGDVNVLLDGIGNFNNWANISAATNPTFYFGDFTGNLNNDLAYTYENGATTFINVLEPNAGLTGFLANFSPFTIGTLGLVFIPGNFKIGGKQDLAVNFPALDQIWLLENSGISFAQSAQPWGIASFAGASMKYTAGDFRGEGKDEIIKFYANTPN